MSETEGKTAAANKEMLKIQLHDKHEVNININE